MFATQLVVGGIGLLLSVTAQLNTASTQDISFGISVPQATAQYGFGEMYLQIKGSARYSWIGIGTGFRMAGSQMFIIHTSASGTNLAISQRSSRGNAEPTYNSSSQMHVIEGSGIAGGVMTANIKCFTCAEFFDFDTTDLPFIYAALEGNPIDSDSTSTSLRQHDNTYGTLAMDMTSTVSNVDGNPFLAVSNDSTPSTTARVSPTSQASDTPSPDGSAGPGSGDGPSGGMIGGVIAGVIVVLVIGMVVFWWWRRRRQARMWKEGNAAPHWLKPELDGETTERSKAFDRAEAPAENARHELEGGSRRGELGRGLMHELP